MEEGRVEERRGEEEKSGGEEGGMGVISVQRAIKSRSCSCSCV